MKNKLNKPERSQVNAPGAQQSSSEKTAGDKSETQKPKSESGEKWKHPDPTIPERKHNPDRTKPEKEQGPMAPGSEESKSAATTPQPQQPSNAQEKNPSYTGPELSEGVGEFIERDIEQLGITGEEKEEEEDLEEEEEQMSPGIQRPQAEAHLFIESEDEKRDEEQRRKSA